MEPRLLKGLQADYIPSHYPGSNVSGLVTYGYNCLVRVDECSPKSPGGVELPPELVDRMTEAAETGVIYFIGDNAFRVYADGALWAGIRPAVGDRIYFEKFAGNLARGRDGHIYRIMDYRNIAAGLSPEALAEGPPPETAQPMTEETQA